MRQVNNFEVLQSRVADLWMKHGRYIWGAVKIAASLLPGGKDRVEIIEKEFIGSDLNISSFTSGSRLKSLSGLKPLKLPDDKIVFPEGFHVALTVAHNEKGDDTILLREMSLTVDEFLPGLNAKYYYRRDGEQIIGAGIVEPRRFSVTVRGSEVVAAYWTQTKTDKPVRGAVDNLFETEFPQLLSFSKSENFIQELTGTIRTVETGLYKLRFRFGYSIAGRIDINYYTEPIMVYNGAVDE